MASTTWYVLPSEPKMAQAAEVFTSDVNDQVMQPDVGVASGGYQVQLSQTWLLYQADEHGDAAPATVHIGVSV